MRSDNLHVYAVHYTTKLLLMLYLKMLLSKEILEFIYESAGLSWMTEGINFILRFIKTQSNISKPAIIKYREPLVESAPKKLSYEIHKIKVS